MKFLFIAFFIVFLVLPTQLSSDQDPEKCILSGSQTNENTDYNYLQTWWNSIRIGKFAVLYVDFPEGRYINGDDTLQPFYDWQLEWVYEHGDIDAAGEMGVVLEGTNIPTSYGNKYVKASKYTWYDRWNMFFDSVGYYTGTVHPDWASHGDSAWGSFKQYWEEASNGKFELIPYTTHPNEQNYKLRTGIINDYEMINGTPVIKCLTLPRKKYGTDDANSYFRNIDSFPPAAPLNMIDDAEMLINTQTDFDLQQFYADGGIVFVYYAGTHKTLRDVGYGALYQRAISVVCGRDSIITSPNSKIDGFGVAAHQVGHIQFGWQHTVSGRCDIMNGHNVHDNNCPQFPNPIYRMKQGWLQPIALESAQELTNLQPIENSYKCGIITIFGKPSASPDWSSGECFVVENRKRIGFDRKIVREDLLPAGFLGGLLVWHHSPYANLRFPESSFDPAIRFKPADNDYGILSSAGQPTSFFAHNSNLQFQYYNLDTLRTFSSNDLSTGIYISNIQQTDYSNINSNIRFDLNYLIAPPRQYSDVIYFRERSNHIINYSDTVFFHNGDSLGFFNFAPGTIIEAYSRSIPNSQNLSALFFKNIECKGQESAPIKFRGVGFLAQKTKIGSINFVNPPSYQNIDSLILRNVIFENTDNNDYRIYISNSFQNYQSPKYILENITFPDNDIYITSHPNSTVTFGKIRLSNVNFRINTGRYYFDDHFSFLNDTLWFGFNNSMTFDGESTSMNIKNSTVIKSDSNIVFKDGSYLNALNSTFTGYSTVLWKGIKFENSGIDSIINCKFNFVKVGLSFFNNGESKFTNRVIKNNIFDIPTGGEYKGLYGENNYSILVEGNRFNLPTVTTGSPIYVGLYLKNGSTSEPPETAGEEGPNETPTNYSLNIINNTFRKGSASIVLADYTSNFLPYYVKGNKFDSSNVNAATANIIGINISGTIRDNIFYSMNTPIGIHLNNSNPDLYNNTIGAEKVAVHLVGHSTPNLAPFISGDEMFWTGGKNRLSSELYDNIQLTDNGNVFTDYGRNRFTITSSSYHIYGWVDTNTTTYYSRNNCWYLGDAAKIYLRHDLNSPPIPTVTYNNGLDCFSEPGPIGWDVDYMGHDIWDTTYKTDDESQSAPTDEQILAAQCEYYFNVAQTYDDAIVSLKSYIDDYPTGDYVKDAMNNLYSCYLYLDTSSSQSYRNTLFGNLIIYAEEKITSNNYGEDFELIAGT